jgi:hypothetical protein
MSHRIRQVGHIEGNFSTHVQIELSHNDASLLKMYSLKAAQELSRAVDTPVSIFTELHLSISRHVFLLPHHIKPFLQKLKSVLGSQRQSEVFLIPELRLYLNDKENTAFVAVPIDLSRSPQILEIIAKVDSVLALFDLQTFYTDPSPHVSLACAVSDDGFKSTTSIQTLCHLSSSEVVAPEELSISARQILICIGKEVHRINLHV